MTAVIIALVVGVFTGAVIVWMVLRGKDQATSDVSQAQSEMRLRIEDTFRQVQQIGAVFANAGHRGRAGEFVLENLLEATGMAQHRDFDVQVAAADGTRPDVVLNLPGRGRLVIDAKFPLDDFQRAAAASTEQERRAALAAYARAVGKHVSELARRDYPSKVKGAIDFTVCFVPGEDLLAAAYEERPGLFYEAIRDRVVIATPGTLMALFWGVAYGWQQDARVQQAQQIGEAGVELHRRLGTLVGHLDHLGSALTRAVKTYNDLLGSVEGRVLPQARKFEDLGILARGTRLPETSTIEAHARPVSVGRYPHVPELAAEYGPAMEASAAAMAEVD
jgi:DNA recombination protein RmuC